MKASSLWLALIVGAHLALGLAYMTAAPALEPSDEPRHYAVVQWLATGHGLPVQDPGAPETTWRQEGSQPPLYYWLAARLTAGIDTSDFERVFAPNPHAQVGIVGATQNVNQFTHRPGEGVAAGTLLAIRMVRLFSLLLSAGAVALTYALARQVFRRQEGVALLAAALVAFNPMALHINASVNNDNLLMPLSSAALALSVHLMQPKVSRWAAKAVGLGALLGCAALTKVSGLVLWPIAALAVAWGAWRARDGRRFLLSGVLIAAPALAISGWWFLRNLQLYGELFGTRMMVTIGGARQGTIGLLELARMEGRGFWQSYWGIFGGFNILAPRWLYILFGALTALAAIGVVVGWLRRRGRPAYAPELALLALFCALTLVSLVSWTRQTYASQGRLMFGAIAPLGVGMAAGLLALIPTRWRKGAALVLAAGLAGVAASVPLTVIAPAYAPPPLHPPGDGIPARRDVNFGGQMRLVGFRLADAPAHPGESVRLELYWEKAAEMPADYSVFVHLVDDAGIVQAQHDSYPAGGLWPTSAWPDGAMVVDRHDVRLPDIAPAPARLQVEIGCYDFRTGQRLPAGDAESIDLGYVTVLPHGVANGLPNPVRINFSDQIALVGFELSRRTMAPGETLRATLWWEALARPKDDYVVFVHLTQMPDAVWAQQDNMPQGNASRTSTWRVGQRIQDEYELKLPAEAPAGTYFVEIGLYDSETLDRLLVNSSDRGIVLGWIKVGPAGH
jgi:4-amino-4-deoxy-L-arabinose transferase-like glycosyltransferase